MWHGSGTVVNIYNGLASHCHAYCSPLDEAGVLTICAAQQISYSQPAVLLSHCQTPLSKRQQHASAVAFPLSARYRAVDAGSQVAPPILSDFSSGKFLHHLCEGIGRAGTCQCCSFLAEKRNAGIAQANMAAKAIAVLRRQCLGSAYQPVWHAQGISAAQAYTEASSE